MGRVDRKAAPVAAGDRPGGGGSRVDPVMEGKAAGVAAARGRGRSPVAAARKLTDGWAAADDGPLSGVPGRN